MSESEIVIPERITFEALNNILLGYLKSGAHEKSVTYKEVASITGILPQTVSRNNKFFVASGFLILEKRGYYKLSDLGIKYSRAIEWKRDNDAIIHLRTILNDYQLIKLVLNYIGIKNEVTREDLVTRIAIFSDVKKEQRFVSGINAFIDMALFSKLIIESNETIKINKEVRKIAEKDLMAEFEIIDKKGEEKKLVIEKEALIGKSITINLNININELSDLELLKEVIKLLKNEYETT